MKDSLREWLVRLWGTFARRDRDSEEELRFHLEMAEQESLRRGGTAREARIQAGGLAQASEAMGDQSDLPWLRDFVRDSRHGARLLARSPLFTAAAILSLALGIGANTAIFSLIDAVMLRMMAVREPASLVQFVRSNRGNFSAPLFRRFQGELKSFEGLLARATMGRREVTFASEPELANTEVVSGNYYSLLGVSAIAGRTFVGSDRDPLAVISYAFWKRRFGMAPEAIGRTFRLNNTVFTIAGVTPPEFFGVAPGEEPEITFPLALDGEVRGGESWASSEGRGWLAVIGRIGKGQSISSAQAEVAAAFSRVAQGQSDAPMKEVYRKQLLAQRMILAPAGNGLDNLRRRFSEPLRILMGIVALVLLIACANLANLLLGRSAARRREIGVRLAMGAGRSRIVRQLLTEGALLAAAGGAIGVLLACWSANALVTVMSNGGDRIALHIRADFRVLRFAAAVSFAACLLFSLAPAIQATRHGIQPALAEARGGARWRLGRGLIAAQVAVSVVLVIAAGLFGRTLIQLYSIESGFERGNILLFEVNSAHAAVRGADLRARLLQDLRSLPGVTSASYAMSAVGKTGWDGSVSAEGHIDAPNENDLAIMNAVAADYFKTLRTPLITGRDFDARDTRTGPKVAIINEAFARRFFPDRQPLGKWVEVAGEKDRREVVGVARNAQPRSLREGVPAMLFLPIEQRRDPGWGSFVVRGATSPAVLETATQRIDRKLRAEHVRSLEEDLSRSILQERIMGTLSGFFGVLSLLLVSVGIYGVMAFQVSRRQKEIGIRMALGARPMQVIGMVVGETVLPVAIGSIGGIAAATALTGFAEKLLFGVKPTDPITFVSACGLLAGLALLAAYLPSRGAARLNPVETLRCE